MSITTNTIKTNIMKAFEIILLSVQFVLFIIVLSNMARLVSDYLISKFK